MTDFQKYNVKNQQIREGREGKILVTNVWTYKDTGEAICWDYKKQENVILKCRDISKKYDLII
jgi:hypothetical protein